MLLLLLTEKVVPEREAESSVAGKIPNRPADRTLQSWSSTLPASVIQQPLQERPPQLAEQRAIGRDQFAVSEKEPKVANARQERINGLENTCRAMHSEESVFSHRSDSIVRYRIAGCPTRKRLGRATYTANQERGWIFETYVSLIDSASRTQTAMDFSIENELSKPKSAKAVLPSSKQRTRSAKPAAQV